jgi:hypothetical protein
MLVLLQVNDDDHRHICNWAVPLESGGEEGHAEVFTCTYIKQTWVLTLPNGPLSDGEFMSLSFLCDQVWAY